MTGENAPAPANNANSTGFENMANKPPVNHNSWKRIAAGLAAAAAVFSATGCDKDKNNSKKEYRGSEAASGNTVVTNKDVSSPVPSVDPNESKVIITQTDTTPTDTIPTDSISTETPPVVVTPPETSLKGEARVIQATPTYDGFNNYPIYTPESVTIEPGLNYENYLLAEAPANAPKNSYGYMDFLKYCEDLGVDPSTIRTTGSRGIVIGDTEKNALKIDDGCDILIYNNGEIVCYYDGGKSNEFAKDGLSLYVLNNDTGRYDYGASMHYSENTMGALELSVKAYLNGDTNPFD